MQGAETCLDPPISRSRYDLMETRHYELSSDKKREKTAAKTYKRLGASPTNYKWYVVEGLINFDFVNQILCPRTDKQLNIQHIELF